MLEELHINFKLGRALQNVTGMERVDSVIKKNVSSGRVVSFMKTGKYTNAANDLKIF